MNRQHKKLGMASQGCSHVTYTKGFRYHNDPQIMITIYDTRFGNGNATTVELHVKWAKSLEKI